MMERKKIFSFLNKIGTLALIFLIFIGGYLLLAKATHLWPFDENYQIVVLEGGLIYFGHLKLFPRISLSEVYFLQNETDEKGNTYQRLVPVSQGMILNQKSKMYLSPQKILWWADLPKESQILTVIKTYKTNTFLFPQNLTPQKNLTPQNLKKNEQNQNR